jgi:predicted metal-dependent peptidase
LTTWQALFKKDARRCNMAADYCINQMIVDLDPKGVVAAAPDSLLLDAQYRGMNTKQIFDLLIADGGRGSGEGDTLDDHGWEEAVQGEEEMRDREKAIDIAIRQGAILAGKMGSGGARVLADLLEPKVDWREQLRDFVTASTSGRDLSTWRRPNRRYLSQGVYMPSSQSESVGHIVVAIDTSGSVGGRELSAFVSELVSICDTVKPDKVTLLWWDTEVCGEQAFEGDYSGMVNQLKPQGGGGTRFECVTVYLDQNRIVPDCLITLTDGYVSQWGSAPHYPSLFGITSKESAPFGVTVRVEGE